MALVWSKEKVALQIDDDPASEPFDGPDDWTVIHVTTAQLESYEGCQKIVSHLSQALGANLATDAGDELSPDADGVPWRLGALGGLDFPQEGPAAFGELEDAFADVCVDQTGYGDEADFGDEEIVPWDERLPEGSVRIVRGRQMSTPEFL